MSNSNEEYNRNAYNHILKVGVLGTVSLCTLVTLGYLGFQYLTHKNGINRQPNPTQPDAPLSTPENVVSVTAMPTPKIPDTPTPNPNCAEILPGQYTWDVAQSIGDPSTIYDFRSYEVKYSNGKHIGTIIPGQWNITTSTENQQKLRKQLPGAIVCAVNPK